MIIRIVKMGFKPEEIDAFLDNFKLVKDKIRNYEGCSHLKLVRDTHYTNQFFTYSHWESEAHLNNYRNSTLFREVWANTKNKFSQKPEAWSAKRVCE